MHRVEQGPPPAPEQPEALDAERGARAHGRARDDRRPPHGRRPLALTLLAAGTAGVLLQLGPAQALSAGREQHRRRRSGRRSPPTGSCRSPSRPTPARPTRASATPRRAPASRSSSRAGRRCSPSSVRASSAGRGVALALRFLGSNRNVAIRGERPGPGRVNYLLGNDPAKWHTGLRTYERVVYRDLWPGVDMVFRAAERHAEVRVPRPPRRPRQRDQARLPRREAALARPARRPAHAHRARRPHRHAAG